MRKAQICKRNGGIQGGTSGTAEHGREAAQAHQCRPGRAAAPAAGRPTHAAAHGAQGRHRSAVLPTCRHELRIDPSTFAGSRVCASCNHGSPVLALSEQGLTGWEKCLFGSANLRHLTQVHVLKALSKLVSQTSYTWAEDGEEGLLRLELQQPRVQGPVVDDTHDAHAL
jgi:hypothetical protein